MGDKRVVRVHKWVLEAGGFSLEGSKVQTKMIDFGSFTTDCEVVAIDAT